MLKGPLHRKRSSKLRKERLEWEFGTISPRFDQECTNGEFPLQKQTARRVVEQWSGGASIKIVSQSAWFVLFVCSFVILVCSFVVSHCRIKLVGSLACATEFL